jgi:hypothetical protein
MYRAGGERSLISSHYGQGDPAMRPTPRSRLLTGLAGAAIAFGAASTLSAATARADDITDLLAGISGDFADGQAAFTAASADFASNEVMPGLTALFDAFDDDVIAPPANLLIGGVETLAGESVINTGLDTLLNPPADFADGIANAQMLMTSGDAYFEQAASLLATGDIGDTVYSLFFGLDETTIDPIEEVILGSLASL